MATMSWSGIVALSGGCSEEGEQPQGSGTDIEWLCVSYLSVFNF